MKSRAIQLCLVIVFALGSLGFLVRLRMLRGSSGIKADIQALQELKVPTTLEQLNALGEPKTQASSFYKSASAVASGVQRRIGRSAMDKLAEYQPKSDTERKLFAGQAAALEPMWSPIRKALAAGRFVPAEQVSTWEDPSSFAGSDFDFISAFFIIRGRAAIAHSDTEKTLETIQVALKTGHHLAGFPGVTCNRLGQLTQGAGLAVAKDLSMAHPTNVELQKKLLELVQESPPIDVRPAFLLSPAMAFNVLDSPKPLPQSVIWQINPKPSPLLPSSNLATSRSVRLGAKRLLASHFRDLFEGMPKDPADKKTLLNLTNDPRLNGMTPEAIIAKALAGKTFDGMNGAQFARHREQILEEIKSRIAIDE